MSPGPLQTSGGAIDVDAAKRRFDGHWVCPDCQLLVSWHFRGNGSRFVGCRGAQAKVRGQGLRDPDERGTV